MLKLSQVGIDLIKSFEGCSLKAYICPGDTWTIGWGTTGKVNGKPITEGMTITQKEADDLFLRSLKTYEDAVNKYVKVLINQNQYDALVSFTYNCGPGALQKSNLLKYLNQGDYVKAAKEFQLWNKAGGKVVTGLTRRRAAEKTLFLKPMLITAAEEDKDLYNAVMALVANGVKLNVSSWNNVKVINLNNVEALLSKLGGIDYLIQKKVISNAELWENKKYSKENVRSLLIKASKML